MRTIDQFVKEVEKKLTSQKADAKLQEVGYILEIRDGVAIVSGLYNCFYGEILEFENGVKGFVIDLMEDTVGVVILGEYTDLQANSRVTATKEIMSVGVGEDLLGRVVNPLSEPEDGGPAIKAKKTYPIERIAPGVVYRQSVSVPLQTGIKAIDALIPIGRGQRELIIGDRSTGKTTVAIDSIINQKGQDVICIYCSIGQKNSKVANIVDSLKKSGADKHTIVVSASASDPAALQYLAPYSAASIGEYFMDQGKDVLIVYDDLTKHAWAYRQVSLILRRPAGREAYPGDIFYLHSRLLERACRLSKEKGGGSITALPIVETLEGDVSAYIPTNIISITDGQLFLETDLFNSGIRPAINVGISVSRVGSSAQTKAMKKVAGRLKLDLAQYRSLSAFSQFESELDAETKKTLDRGDKLVQIFKQKKNQPYTLGQQVAVLWAAVNGYLDGLPTDKIEIFEKNYIADLEKKGKKALDKIMKQKEITPDIEAELKKFVMANVKL